MSRKKRLQTQPLWKSVGLKPIVDLGLSQTQDVLGGIGRSLAAANIDEVQAAGSLVQSFLIAGRIAVVAVGALLDQSSGFGVVLLLTDRLLYKYHSFLNVVSGDIIQSFSEKSRVF